jgi:hypothetical protein
MPAADALTTGVAAIPSCCPGRACATGRHERTRRMTTDRYRRPDRAATVQPALCRLQRAERRRTREPHEGRGVRGLTLDEATSLLAKATA